MWLERVSIRARLNQAGDRSCGHLDWFSSRWAALRLITASVAQRVAETRPLPKSRVVNGLLMEVPAQFLGKLLEPKIMFTLEHIQGNGIPVSA